MDLVGYREDVFRKIVKDYSEFLNEINLKPKNFVPISAREGDNLTRLSNNMSWYKEMSALEALDGFEKEKPKYEQSFRMPVQDIYKFTEENDDRRIVAGRVETGSIKIGDKVVFLPSRKTSFIKSIEVFNAEKQNEVFAGQSTGFILDTQIYIRPGEIMAKELERQPHIGRKFKANIFWMGRQPLVQGKSYKLKIASQHVPMVLSEIIHVLDASELSSLSNKSQVDRYDVAECVIEALKPIAFDEVKFISETGRFVVVDNYEIAGGGIILAPVFDEETALKEHIRQRDQNWLRSDITADNRAKKYQHNSALIVLTGEIDTGKQRIARALEEKLYADGKNIYFLGVANEILSDGAQSKDKTLGKVHFIQQVGDLARVMTDAGLVLITSITDIDEYELDILRQLNRPNKIFVVRVGGSQISPAQADVSLERNVSTEEALEQIIKTLSPLITLDPEFTI
jgi:bifunctional enzyme CysN/CysC